MKKIINTMFISVLFSLLTCPVLATTVTIKKPTSMPAYDIGTVIGAVIGFLLVIAAIAAFLFLIIGGIQWITSGGDKAGMEGARNRITAAIIGLIIVAAAWAIMALLGQFIGWDFLNNGMTFTNMLGE